MRKNPLVEKNKELTIIINSLNNMVSNQKDEIEELNNTISALEEEHEIEIAEINDQRSEENKKINAYIAQLKEEIKSLKLENETLKARAKVDSKSVQQLSLNETAPSKVAVFGGMEMINKAERLDRSKLPPKPVRPEFDTDFTLYTDGACLGNGQKNLGYGGWGYVILDNTDPKAEAAEASGSAGPNTTNQVMELTAMLRGIEEVSILAPEDATLTICSDSQYCINGVTNWSIAWRENGWRNSKGDPVANKELWMALLNAIENSGLNITFKWVKGHASNHYNSVCDLLATSAAAEKAAECGCHAFDEQIPTY